MPLGGVAIWFAARIVVRLVGPSATAWISGPKYFQEFGPVEKRRDWRNWTLSSLSLAQLAGWIGLLVLCAQEGQLDLVWRLSIILALHVSLF